jgi:hypothetical protein
MQSCCISTGRERQLCAERARTEKKELRKFNLFQITSHLMTQFNRSEARCLEVICDHIRNKQTWSKYVDNIWQEGLRLSSNFPFVEQSSDDPNMWSATSADKTTVHLVTVADLTLGSIPTCGCLHFTSTLIPCAGICAVFSRLEGNLFAASNLHQRWRLNTHPLYKQALKKLRIADNDVDSHLDATPRIVSALCNHKSISLLITASFIQLKAMSGIQD